MSKWTDGTSLKIYILSLLSFVLLSACVYKSPKIYGVESTSPAPQIPWVPPKELISTQKAIGERVTIPSNIKTRLSSLNLVDLVDLALRNSPKTKEAWAQAISSAYAYKSKIGEYYPRIGATATVGRTEGSFANGTIGYFQRNYGPRIDMTWLIFDFGGREAGIEEMRQALISADWNHNQAIQDVILLVQQAYYNYIKEKALYKSGLSALEEAKATLSISEERHTAGLATIAEVLQAKTALAEANFRVVGIEGDIKTIGGALATAVGLPANTPYDVEMPKEEKSIYETTDAVENYLLEAEKNRPNIAEARAQVAKADAHIKKIRAGGFPTFSTTAGLERIYYDNRGLYGNTYSALLQIKIPLFNGFSLQNDLEQAKAEKEAARERLQETENLVSLQVWSSYYNLKTAEQKVKASEELLKSASESHDVALARYKAGVGNILDLLSAQASLEMARSSSVQAYSDWNLALAQLTHDTGRLSLSSEELKRDIGITSEREIK